jgi:hypothetical protein
VRSEKHAVVAAEVPGPADGQADILCAEQSQAAVETGLKAPAGTAEQIVSGNDPDGHEGNVRLWFFNDYPVYFGVMQLGMKPAATPSTKRLLIR